MNAGRKNSTLTQKKAAKPASSGACCLCGVNFKISVGDFGGNNKYISTENLLKIPERAGVDKIRLADLLVLNWTHKMENLPVNEQQPFFARALTPILQDKKPTDDQN